MTNQQLAAIILIAYTIPGLLLVLATWSSKEFSEDIDRFSTLEQVLFVLFNVILWPVVVVKAIVKASEMRRRDRK